MRISNDYRHVIPIRPSRVRRALAAIAIAFAICGPVSADPWHYWRGAGNAGYAPGDAPVSFSATENVRWRVQIPGKGNSTPVVAGGSIFLTTAVPVADPTPADEATDEPALPVHDFVVLALDASTGKERWRKTAKTEAPHERHHRRYGSFASNSPSTDGEILIVNFGSRGLYAYDLDGKQLWSRNLGKLFVKNTFGEGSTPVLHGDNLILQNDHEGQSYIVVMDKRTGKEIWRANRDERTSWAPPVVVNQGGREQVVTSASRRVRSYDLATGELIWETAGLGSNAIPAVVNVSDEMVIAMTGHRDPNLLAIRLGAKGDITGDDTYIEWTNQRGNPYTTSPVLNDGILYMVTDKGLVSAFDVKTGKAHYQQQRLPDIYAFKASPIAANGKLYLASQQGDVIVLQMGKEYEVLAINEMGDEMFVSSPIIANGSLFLRSQDELICIGTD